MTQAAEQSIPGGSEAGPGTLLRQARADLRLSVEDVAQRLRLAPRQIAAIENEDYERLPGPTYVRGYLRSYAQLLGLAPDPVLERYNRQPAAAKPIDFAKHTPTPQMSSDHHVIKITTLVVAGLVLGLAALWWQGRDDSPIRLRKPPTLTPSDSIPSESFPAPDETAPAPTTERAPASDNARTADAATTMPPVEVPKPVAGPRPLVLHFEQDSWADVRDGTNRRLLYSVIPAGRVIRLGGTPPFSVYLGNVSGVRVEYQGKPVDLEPYRRGPIARVTLGNGTAVQTP